MVDFKVQCFDEIETYASRRTGVFFYCEAITREPHILISYNELCGVCMWLKYVMLTRKGKKDHYTCQQIFPFNGRQKMENVR